MTPRVTSTSQFERSVAALIEGRHRDPFAILGPHPAADRRTLSIRAMHPAALAVDVLIVDTGEIRAMHRRGEEGLFEATIDGGQTPDYRLRITYQSGHVLEIDDPYRYGPVLGDLDLHLFAEGTHHRLFEKLGAHPVRVGSTSGVHFAVWAPNAERVSLVGDFNGWDGRVLPMRLLVPSGVWEIFIPDLPDGEKYKFEILTGGGALVQKSDPFGLAFEEPPRTASIVRKAGAYPWGDAAWMDERRGKGA